MPIPIPSVKITLSYPLWACDFDPNNANHLLVGGGGGSGRHGVGNKLTLLDVSNETDVSNIAEIELSKSEDNVTSLAVSARKVKGITAFAGVNGSPEDVHKGKNPHFRIFGITQPGKAAKSSGVGISELGRDSLFVCRDGDTYQRLLRISQPFDGLTQLGAVATGLSKEPQLALFDVPPSGAARWKSRARLDIPNEAMDLDVVQTGPDTYQLAYCDNNEIFTVDVSKEEISEAKCVYTLTSDDGDKGRPAFKSLRYLSPNFLFATANKPARGVVLHGYRLPTKEDENARLAVVKELPESVARTTGMAVRNLTPPSSPTEKQGDAQYVIAVAGADSSISLFTMEHKTAASVDLLADLAPVQTIKGVHPNNIIGLSFSSFSPPKSSKSASDLSIKLASVSGNTAVVHSIPLRKYVDKSAPARKGGPPRQPRYVVALKSQKQSPAVTLITLLTLVILILAIIGQVFLEAIGVGQPVLGARNYLPASWTVPIRKGPVVGQTFLGDLLTDVKLDEHQKIVIRHDDASGVGPDGLPQLKADIHDEELHGPAKPWEELETQEQHIWKQRLQKTGHWVEDMGETVFKGILFGEIGGAIGAMVGEAL